MVGRRLGGRSSAEDGQVVAVTEAPEVLVAKTPEVLNAVTGIPEVVDTEIPEGPTTRSGGCLGGRLIADAGAVITWGDLKIRETDAT